jgi:hypothetical protein
MCVCRNDIRCDPEHCSCTNCYNDGQHEKDRLNAIRRIRRNKPDAFKGTRLEVKNVEIRTPGGTLKQARGCRCIRSKCQKKYCECFGAGLACTVHCVCTDCENGNERSPVAEDLIMKPQFKAQPAHVRKREEAPKQPKADGRHQQRAAALHQKQQQQQQQQQQQAALAAAQEEQQHLAKKRRQQHQEQQRQRPAESAPASQPIRANVPASISGPPSWQAMPAPSVTPSNLCHKKRPNMTVLVPNPPLQPDSRNATPAVSAAPEGLANPFDFAPTGFPPSGRDIAGLQGGSTPKGIFDMQFSARQDLQGWDPEFLAGGLRSDGSMGAYNSPRTRSMTRQLQREPSDLGVPWSAGGMMNLGSARQVFMQREGSDLSVGALASAGGSMQLRRSQRGPGGSTADFGSLNKNSPPVSPGIWGSEFGLQDTDGILFEPGSARAWVNHIPGPQRETSGLSSSGR